MLSIIIPDRQGQPYLQKTIDGLFENATGDIEIIVVCDGTWPDPSLKTHPRVIQIHHGTQFGNLGMRTSINRGIAVSHGEYIMKIDEHCMVGNGFDKQLIADCEDNWVVIPRRWRLDADEWKVTREMRDQRPPVDYMFVAYPYERPNDKTCGLHGAEWKERFETNKQLLIDETPTMQGSCYFMKRSYWDKLLPNGLNPDHYGEFTQEAQEISMAAWLSGGKVMVNKKTWYAHMHKGKRGKGYGFSNEQYKRHMIGTEKGRVYAIEYWITTKEYLHDFEWFINHFWPIPTWPDNWKERVIIDRKFDYSLARNMKGEIK